MFLYHPCIISRTMKPSFTQKVVSYKCQATSAKRFYSMQQSTAHATTTQADVSKYMQSALTYYKYFQWERAIDNFSRVIECNSREPLDSQVQDNPLSQERKPLDEVMRRDQVLLAYRCRGKLFHIKHDYKRAVDRFPTASICQQD